MKQCFLRVSLILVTVVAFHGRSLRYGLLLDDYNHRAELRDGDWSFKSLVNASHLGDERRRVRMWWQDEADLYFFRPLAFFLMRLEYVIGGWRAAVMHVFSLFWGMAAATLVVVMAGQALGDMRWGTLAGVLFAIHPANALTTSWIACQNEQMATVFVLAGLLCYGRYSGWWAMTGGPVQRGGRWNLVASVTLFGAALATRESSVMFVPLVVLGDAVVQPGHLRSRWRIYIVLAVVVGAYLAVRGWMVGPLVVPGRPYAWPPDSPGFARFVFDKFVYYVLGLVSGAPMVASAGIQVLRTWAGLFYGAFLTVVLLYASLLWVFRSSPILRLWGLMMLMPLLPVLPVFASSHHLYLASAGFVLILVSCARWALKLIAGEQLKARLWYRRGVAVLLTGYTALFGFLTVVYHIGLSGYYAANQLPVDEVACHAGPLRPGDCLFFINLPMLGFNCMPGIEEAAGAAPLEGYVLTFSPALTVMPKPGYVRRFGDRQLLVGLDGDGYFSGETGRSFMEAIGRTAPFGVGETFEAPEFRVEIKRAGSTGVNEILFTFRRSLDDPHYHFFFGSPVFVAYPLVFDRVQP